MLLFKREKNQVMYSKLCCIFSDCEENNQFQYLKKGCPLLQIILDFK